MKKTWPKYISFLNNNYCDEIMKNNCTAAVKKWKNISNFNHRKPFKGGAFIREMKICICVDNNLHFTL